MVRTSAWKRTLLSAAILAAAMLIMAAYGRFNGQKSILIRAAGNSLEITVGEEYRHEIVFAEMDEVTLLETFFPGDMVQGGESGAARWGLWKNESLGNYYLATCGGKAPWIFIRCGDQMNVLSFEDAEVTEKMYEALLQVMNQDPE